MLGQRSLMLGRSVITSQIQSSAKRLLCSATEQTPSKINKFKEIAVTIPKPFVYQVELNKPQKYNAISMQMWIEIKDCFEQLSDDPDCRVIILSGAGKHFTAGIDLNSMMKLGQELSQIEDVGRKAVHLNKRIKLYQDGFSALEVCRKPVIAAVHSACIGAGIDIITAADIRYCSEDAWFQVKEVEIGMAADVGTLQRLPKAIGSQSLARELCLTGRKFLSKEAHASGLVSKVFADKDTLINGAIELAETIASMSPIAVQATKKNMVYSLDHTNQEGLDQIREMNQAFLQSEDFANAVMAQISKDEKPVFSKL
ncbi:unnamed protein product [Hermetia illucens]|uniref:Delta(3,5)-Delta(2,4)-dienoyl-CoA isomerase, mitochondrial n=1 Tax=Hermetia illucens TaxID=343691 RepID=A0A7R8UZX4_HERIL|nr:delta(3,5)-Delta(2,4)-dienoyl-CoA isomerase, mitochondrial [Hermetia illucens]CAD7089669.1 unnamed protein product [Hermetia illucens]